MTTSDAGMRPEEAVILFDGVCNLCNASVNFVLDRDKKHYFKFGALQSEEGAALLEKAGFSTDYLESIVLVESGNVFSNSDAALKIARKLNAGWPLFYVFYLVPRILRDPVYKWVARNRYSWFGKQESCRIPTPEIQARFI